MCNACLLKMILIGKIYIYINFSNKNTETKNIKIAIRGSFNGCIWLLMCTSHNRTSSKRSLIIF